ncbi:hypothetical protein BIFBIF_01727 [Bifidobacterium bifidum ATCC 29521 = JCM 1255 = DSM 20456]|nr:hypothetical protein BIFBIF_01727 [Bifidobacterium bifidum ATCC 29521 = JCM 1255 = DSM 20456]
MPYRLGSGRRNLFAARAWPGLSERRAPRNCWRRAADRRGDRHVHGRLESGALTRRQAPYDAACGTPCC